MNLPNIRLDLLVQDLSNEILIYDTNFNKAYCLNSTAKIVFNACDGKTTLEDLKHHLPEDIIFLSLDELKKNNLIENDFVSPLDGINRREVIKKAGLATMAALPIITAIAAPKAIYAQSTCGQACSQLGTCVGACPNCTGSFACNQSINISCTTIGALCNVGDTCNTSNPANQYCNNTFTGPCTTDADCVGTCFDNNKTGTCTA